MWAKGKSLKGKSLPSPELHLSVGKSIYRNQHHIKENMCCRKESMQKTSPHRRSTFGYFRVPRNSKKVCQLGCERFWSTAVSIIDSKWNCLPAKHIEQGGRGERNLRKSCSNFTTRSISKEANIYWHWSIGFLKRTGPEAYQKETEHARRKNSYHKSGIRMWNKKNK